MLAGEPGIGKSELARLAANHAAGKGLPVHWGFCWEAGGAPAYWPWIQSLRSLVKTGQHEESLDLERRLFEVFPEEMRDSERGPRERLLADQAMFQMMNTVLGLLNDATRDNPLMLILEDLHAADADTLGLLHFIAPFVKTMPLVLIGTFRETEARISRDAASLWQAARNATILRPGRLDQAQVRHYLEQVAPSLASEENAGLLYQTTEGNPLFLVELVDLLASSEAPIGHGMQLPDSIHQVIGGQVSRLPVSARDLLQHAAVLGRSFESAELASFAGVSEEEIAAVVHSPECQVLLKQVSDDTHRFSHILYRDVLHQGLPRQACEKLHLKRATQLREAAGSGQFAPWSEIATHLEQAGSAKRPEAVSAWREAAEQATRKLAFVDASACLRKATGIFGEGPVAGPEGRSGLLLDLAQAELRAGNIDRGRDYCRDAYRIAETLADPALMSRAALVYGNAFVVGHVDPELVGFLENALGSLPAENIEMRARVTARLAAALQPAPDPGIPMEMAREAIALARKSDIETVLFETLRSAISALMDFAGTEERLQLNREYVELAEKRRDVPEQFRGNLRILIDAAESGDAVTMDEAISACSVIAERIDLPHYRWPVESALAMRAMLRGQFEEARQHMALTNDLANAASDEAGGRISTIQQYSGCRLWLRCDLAKARTMVDQLQTTYTNLPEMRFFFMAHEALGMYEAGNTESAGTVFDTGLIDDLLKRGDQSSVVPVAELALYTDRSNDIQSLYDRLLPSAGACAHWGLMGMTWEGPIDRVLALLAASLGKDDAARAHFDSALSISRRMSAEPFTALILSQFAAFLGQQGEKEKSRELLGQSREIAERLGLEKLLDAAREAGGSTHETESPETGDSAAGKVGLQPQGEVWEVRFGGNRTTVKNSKGVRILAHLLSHAEQEFHVVELNNLDAPETLEEGDAGPLLDQQARRQYQDRLEALSDELEQAEELGDSEAADRVREEMDVLGRELSRAFGLGGRQRRGSSTAERARVNVQRRVRDAIKRIAQLDPEAGKFLDNSIKTGNYCSYRPA